MAVLSVLPFMSVCSEDGPCGIFLGVFGLLGFGGAILSAMLSNLHDPNPVLIVLFNWVFFGFMGILITSFIKRRKEERGAANV
jgi:hypothetical protein